MSRFTLVRLGEKFGVVDNEADHDSPERFARRDLPSLRVAEEEARQLNREHEEAQKP